MKKKPILITAFSVLLCLSLVLAAVFHNPLTAFAVSVPSDNQYVFETGDAIRVLGWYGKWADCPNGESDYWNATKLTYNGRKWKSDDYMRWQNTEESHHFLAVYPYNFANETTDLTAVEFDLLTAETKDILASQVSTQKTATVNFEMEHLMAMFDVHLTFNEQYDGKTVEIVSVSAKVQTAATINFLTENGITVTPSGNLNTQTLDAAETAQNTDWSGSGIFIPQTAQNVEITIKITVDSAEKTLTYTMDELALESGKRATLTLLVGEEFVKVKAATVTPWDEADLINAGEAEEIQN